MGAPGRGSIDRVRVVGLVGPAHARLPGRRGPVRLPLALVPAAPPGIDLELRRLPTRAAAFRDLAARDPRTGRRLAMVAGRGARAERAGLRLDGDPCVS